MTRIGIIGGSGLYDIEGITNIKEKKVETPFGDPSDNYIIGELEGVEIIFLPRHGRGHIVMPTDINYRANIYGMKSLGVEKIISFSAAGSLREDLNPGTFVIVDQFFDRTNATRCNTFFCKGIVAHIAFAEPVCGDVGKLVFEEAKEMGIKTVMGGTYVNMEGPAFSTKAESNLYRKWGMDVIGMTNLIEAKLAREAEICYCTVAMITDYDCWHPNHDSVTVDMIVECLNKNSFNAKKLIKKIVPKVNKLSRDCVCSKALATAIITSREKIPAGVKKKLKVIIGKYIN
ncbi:MAG: S-methyl-5'-thioadenosine phosphorylase [Candidatus Auribacterota bacterium]|nr:S-methyl-5'-thioadenosine phosphorylase [Candidatus Auribacterota bacterium]